VEFAVVAPVLLFLLAAVLDYSAALRTAASVANAARIGAQYGSRSTSGATDTAGIQAAAINSAPGVSGMTVTSTRTCQCPGGGAVSCTGSCGSSKMLIYVQVTVQATSTAIFRYAALGFSGRTTARATMRVQ
jgi:Flp pilus assembly protein TadG